jgi:hypothetical protein
MMILNFLRATGQRVLEPRQLGAECSRGAGAGQARRGLCPGLRDEAFLHGQLRAGGVAHAAQNYGAPHPALPGRETLMVYGLEQCRMRRLRGRLAW